MLNDKELNLMLQKLEEDAQDFLEEEFEMDLEIPIKVNGRLKRALGRFIHRNKVVPVRIELSKVTLNNGYEVALDILKHELVHYALFSKGLPYKDSDYFFTAACESRGVSLTETVDVKQVKPIYKCAGCGIEYAPLKKLNTNKTWSHKGCGGIFEFVGREER